MKRNATAVWAGSLKEGAGKITTQSNVLSNTQYSFKTRFEDGNGTNPEELVAAAHAGCFTMAVSLALTEKGINPTALDTQATVSMAGFDITGVHLSISGVVPGISEADFIAVTKIAEQNCLISKVLNIPITSEAQLVA